MPTSSSLISGPGPLPPTFVSAGIAACVQDNRNNAKDFLKACFRAQASCFDKNQASRLDDNCPVCLQPLTTPFGAALYNPKCQHIFHRECLELLLPTHTQCPICRTTWCGSALDVRRATSIHYTLRELHLNNRFEMFWDLSEFLDQGGTKEDLQYLLHTAICIAAHCMQVQRISSYDWMDVRAQGYILSDPILRCDALEEEDTMKDIAKSAEGHCAVELILRSIERLTPQTMEECVFVGGHDSDNVGALVEILMEKIRFEFEAWTFDGREMSVEVQRFTKEILKRALEAVLKGVYGYDR